MLMLEAIVSHPTGTWPEPKEHPIPAGWWLWCAENPAWVRVCEIRWWRVDALVRLFSWKRRHYWPLQLRWSAGPWHGRVVWRSRCARKESPHAQA